MLPKDFVSQEQGLVVLTGAGISAESGLATFRDPQGIWTHHRIEDVATPEAFERDPQRVLDFYNMRRRQAGTDRVAPNAAHHALATLERRWRGDFLLVTQNVDDLHDRAGSSALVHMHGQLQRSRCHHCGHTAASTGDLTVTMTCASCGRTGGLRPAVVWFGEMPLEMERIHAALERCDLFVAAGTSGHVYPAAGFVQLARAAGATTVELNLEPSQLTALFDVAIQGRASEIVPAFVREVLAVKVRTGTGGRQSNPISIARSTALVRSRTPSFASTEETWFLIVPSDLLSAEAISLFE